MDGFIIKGNICHSPSMENIEVRENAYAVCVDGVCCGVCEKIPKQYGNLPVKDYGDSLILPGMVDLHIHAPQYAFRGTGMDYELLEWLKNRTFPEEIKYEDIDYAARAYGMFAEQMKKSATTRAVIFGTIHREATLLLMNLMEESGLITFVGKVNMDRDAPPKLREEGAESSAKDTIRFIREAEKRGYLRTKPILTPRFIPCCSNELLSELSKVQKICHLPVQSHLSENPGEVELAGKLMPEAKFYGDGYDRYGLFGREARTIMAHCVYSTEEEVARMKENGVWVAHCPNSNMNLSSGIAPIRKYISLGLKIGLGSDVAGGQTESMFRAITDAIQASKLYWRYIDQNEKALTFSESFYLATKGGGSFFGKVGSFEKGYEFDAVVLDDSVMPHPQPLTVAERLERAVYLGLDRDGIRAKYIGGVAALHDKDK